MRTPSSALPLMANPFVRTAGQLTFAWSLVGIELEVLTSHDKLKLGNKSLEIYQMLVQHIARDSSGLSLARRKDATCFLRWIMSVMTNSTVQACHQKANLCGSHYPLHMAVVEVSSQRILVDKAFSVPKCVRLARMSRHSHRLLKKILGTVPREQRDDLSEIWGEELSSLEGENTGDFERQNTIGKPMNSAPAQEENDTTHEKMMELEPLLEASEKRNLRSIDITHGECPCHCLEQTVWYPEHSNLCLVWDVEKIRSIGLPDHQQKVTILVVSTMLALRWIEENVTKYRKSKTPTAESIYAIDYSRRLELFETACKVFAIPMEVRHVWSRIRFLPWF